MTTLRSAAPPIRPSSGELRRSLLGGDATQATRRSPAVAVPLAEPNALTPMVRPAAFAPDPPLADELLAAAPAVRRLCDSYHRTQRSLRARGRSQRTGLGLLVAVVGIGAVMLNRSATLTPHLANTLVLAVAGASCVGLGILAMLWVRDEHRLRDAQGDRLLRALQFNCTLPGERISALRRCADPTAAFFACYALWRTENADRVGGLAGLIIGRAGSRARPAR